MVPKQRKHLIDRL